MPLTDIKTHQERQSSAPQHLAEKLKGQSKRSLLQKISDEIQKDGIKDSTERNIQQNGIEVFGGLSKSLTVLCWHFKAAQIYDVRGKMSAHVNELVRHRIAAIFRWVFNSFAPFGTKTPVQYLKAGYSSTYLRTRLTVRTLEPWTLDICLCIFLVTIECGLDLLIRVFNVFTLTKCETCNTMHHKKNHYVLIVEQIIYSKMSSVHGSSVLTVTFCKKTA